MKDEIAKEAVRWVSETLEPTTAWDVCDCEKSFIAGAEYAIKNFALQEQLQHWPDYTRCLLTSGYASVQMEMYEDRQWFGGTLFLYALWVNEDARLQGHGTAMLKLAEETAIKHGHKTIHLEYNPKSSPKAILEWYLRNGYEKLGCYRDRNVMLRKDLINKCDD